MAERRGSRRVSLQRQKSGNRSDADLLSANSYHRTPSSPYFGIISSEISSVSPSPKYRGPEKSTSASTLEFITSKISRGVSFPETRQSFHDDNSKGAWLNEPALWERYYNQKDRATTPEDGDSLFSIGIERQGTDNKLHSISETDPNSSGEVVRSPESKGRQTQIHNAVFRGTKVSPVPLDTASDTKEKKEPHSLSEKVNQILFVNVIKPHHKFHRFWELFIVLCVLWSAIVLPIQLAFVQGATKTNSIANVIDSFVDAFFISDLVLNFATAYVDEWGCLVDDRREIGRAYLGKWFWVDLPATLPFELFVPPSEATAINMVKCIRLIRIAKIFKFLERFQFANSARIIRLFASLMLVCHWIGCLWFFIGVNPRTECDAWPDFFDPTEHEVMLNGTWVFLDGPAPANTTIYCSWLSIHRLGTDAVSSKTKYLRSLYWAVTTITSVGYGDIVPVTDGETLFTILNMLLGAGIYAMIFSNFVSYIARIDQASTKYTEKMEDIRTQMRYLRLPPAIRNKVEMYFEYVWLCHKGLLDRSNYFFDELPLPLHLECAEFLYLENVRKNPLFDNCSKSFLRGVLVRLKPQIVVPGEYVVNRGDAATAMYFIARGELEVLTDFQGEQLCTLGVGDYFGDIGVLTKRKRTASIRALTFCDLHFLVSDELRDLLFMYEHDAAILSNNALDFVKKFEQEAVHQEQGLTEQLRRATLIPLTEETEESSFASKGPMPPSEQQTFALPNVEMIQAQTTGLMQQQPSDASSPISPLSKRQAAARSQMSVPFGGKKTTSQAGKALTKKG